jgi:hypothetical protein
MFFVLTGRSSILSSDFNPPINASNKKCTLGLTNFEVYNSIPNIQDGCNKFYFGYKQFTIPTGCYQLQDINKYLQDATGQLFPKSFLDIKANNNTLHCHIKATEDVDFTKPNTIAPILGFGKKLLRKNQSHDLDEIADIMKINSICVECNITVSSFQNGKPAHIIHHFFHNVPPGFKIVESPEHVIYLPVSVNTIRNITLKIRDQDGELINFRNETVTVGLHLKTDNQ